MRILTMQYYSGRNIYLHRPVLKVTIDMEQYYRRDSIEYIGLKEILTRLLPGLENHHCSRGRSGGFIERVSEGTYLSHIIEHVLLEILTVTGQKVKWGKTISGPEDRTYTIIAECNEYESGRKAAFLATEIVRSAAEGIELSVQEKLEIISELTQEKWFGPSTGAIVSACQKRNIPYLVFPNGIVQIAYGKRQKRICGTVTSKTQCLSADIASDKELTKSILADFGLPILPGRIVYSEKEALLGAKQIGYPVVVKPNNGNHGRGVSINLQTSAEVRAAYKIAYMHDKDIIIEKYLHGKHYRLLTINGHMKACAERVPPSIIGNGVNTVQELINQLNMDSRRGKGHGNIRTKINIDAELILTISRHKRSLNHILSNEEVLILRENANLSCGAGANDVTDQVHPTIIDSAELAAKALGLDIAGVDLVAEDISLPLSDQKAAIIEVNASPGLRMHLFPDIGDPQPIGDHILQMLFPTQKSAHISLVTVTGTNGKTTTTRLIGAIMSKNGECVGMTTTGGIFIDGKCIVKGDTTGPESAKTVLKHPDVTAAVLETARGGIVRAGLGYDLADVAVITNITEDHLGQDGIETLEGMAHVKALVAEAIRPNGVAVLNADDEYSMGIKHRITARIIYFSDKSDSPLICRHLGAGGEALFVKDGSIVHAIGNWQEVLCDLIKIPITHGGRAQHNVSNVLAAASAAKALNIATETIVDTLKSFGLSPEDNPGRLHIEEVDGITVIIDYGHNLEGYRRTADFARTLSSQRLIGIVGLPGDRNDESIIKIGIYAGGAFDEVWIKEDKDLRGRKSGEVAKLLKLGALQKTNLRKIHICLDESLAVQNALGKCKSGDVVLIFYEHLEPIVNIVKDMRSIKNSIEA